MQGVKSLSYRGNRSASRDGRKLRGNSLISAHQEPPSREKTSTVSLQRASALELLIRPERSGGGHASLTHLRIGQPSTFIIKNDSRTNSESKRGRPSRISTTLLERRLPQCDTTGASNPRVGHKDIEFRGGPGAHKRPSMTKRLRALMPRPRDSRFEGRRPNFFRVDHNESS
jgi:hypothetical protein